jgi:glycosyltransferase involved in cell wall biosynthesis
MRIVHVITRMILGGAQENTLFTCEGLHARGHEVALITGPPLGPEGELLDRARAGGYTVIVLESIRRAIHPVLDVLAYRALCRLLRQLEPDVVHTHSSKTGVLGRQAAYKVGRRRGGSRKGIKIVHTIHGLPFHRYNHPLVNRLYVALERRAARQSDAIVSVADAMTSQALAAGIGRPEQFTTIYSGMEVDTFLNRPPGVETFRESLGLAAADVLVTQVARLAELKGHEFILAAAEGIPDPRVRFCFVGDGARRGAIERTVRKAGLHGRVNLTGLLPPEQMPLVMHASDIVVHCSLREGLARALPQAMLAGKPVVSFDVDGAREVVNPDTGVLLAPGDVAGLRAAVMTLARAPDLRARLGEHGRQRAAERFDHNLMVEQIEALYQRII